MSPFNFSCSSIPPVEDKIDSVGNVSFISCSEGRYVTLSQCAHHEHLPEKWRITDNEVRLLPLEPADPEHQFGDPLRPFLDLDAVELFGSHHSTGEASRERHTHAVFSEVVEQVDDLVFDAFEQIERHVQKVSRSAGGVENAD